MTVEPPGDASGGPGTDGPPPSAGAARLLSAFVLLAVIGGGVWFVWARREAVGAALGDIGPVAASGCLGLTFLGVLATGECWRVWLASLVDPPPRRTSHQLFYVTQSGKYLPGSLWPFLAQAVLARRFGVPRVALLTATSLFLLTHVVTGVLVGVLGAGAAVAADWRWLIYPVTAGGIVLLLPPVLVRVVSVLQSRPGGGRRRGPGQDVVTDPLRAPGWRTVGQALLLMLLAWVAYGGATWLLVQRLEPGLDGTPLVVGAVALAWVVGFLVVAAPAGVGAREAVLVVVLAPLLGTSGAVTVALVSRVALTVADLALAAASAPVLRLPPEGSAGRAA